MKIKLIVQEQYKEPEIHICNREDNDRVRDIYRTLREVLENEFTVYDNDTSVRIREGEIIRVLAQNKQVYVDTPQGRFRVRERLYELEEKLPQEQFVRISNSEIVNIRKVLKMDTGLTGTIKMYLKNDIETYVSRRNVVKIKQALGLK